EIALWRLPSSPNASARAAATDRAGASAEAKTASSRFGPRGGSTISRMVTSVARFIVRRRMRYPVRHGEAGAAVERRIVPKGGGRCVGEVLVDQLRPIWNGVYLTVRVPVMLGWTTHEKPYFPAGSAGTS